MHNLQDPTLEVFLAHACALEQESVDRYRELADVMTAHNNTAVAELFQQFAQFGEAHAAEAQALAQGLTLPQLRPWEFAWQAAEGPETGAGEDTHYLMTVSHALDFALHNEKRGQGFYADLAAQATREDVRKLAAEFAAEEAEHVKQLEQWIASAPGVPPDWDTDPDPPNSPD